MKSYAETVNDMMRCFCIVGGNSHLADDKSEITRLC